METLDLPKIAGKILALTDWFVNTLFEVPTAAYLRYMK
jgi:hypothetical protein